MEEASPAACFDKVRAFCKQRRVPVDGGRKNLPETGGVQCAREYVRFNRALGPCSLHALHDFIYAHGQRSRAEPWAVARAELVGAAAPPRRAAHPRDGLRPLRGGLRVLLRRARVVRGARAAGDFLLVNLVVS